MIRAATLAITTALAGAFLVTACSSNDTAPGATSADEDRQLNEAAAMLDANSIDLNAVDPASVNESTTQ